MADIFEKASKMKLRFSVSKGNLSTEDLWALPLKSNAGYLDLDTIAVAINKQLKESSEESFVDDKTTADPILQLKLDILKRIIEVKKEENATRMAAASKAAEKKRILNLIAEKKDEAMAGKSIEELTAMLEKL